MIGEAVVLARANPAAGSNSMERAKSLSCLNPNTTVSPEAPAPGTLEKVVGTIAKNRAR